jgi:hypothetical protein
MLRLREVAEASLRGEPRGQVLPEFGALYWDVEEGAYLRLATQKDVLFAELAAFCRAFLAARGIATDDGELDEVLAFQKALIPDWDRTPSTVFDFEHSVPEYFSTFFLPERAKLARRPQRMTLEGASDFGGDKRIFAQRVVMWGRKSAKMLTPYSWQDC